jgi:N-acetylmuramoyl-L-alanine amidase/putative methionine-R-sulfoxide reductase with GAF domain
MATSTTKPEIEIGERVGGAGVPAWPGALGPESVLAPSATSHDALHALLAFSALHEQVRRRKALASKHATFDSKTPLAEFDPTELFVLDEVLQLVAERAVAITGADGLAIALAENDEIVLRAAAGMVRPDVGARIDRDSAFSGACFRTAQVVNCDDTETDSRVNLQACRKLGARSMVAVPLCGRRRVIGVLEAFSTWPFGFNETDVQNLTLLAELILAALKPEDEDRFAQSAQVAATKLDTPKPATAAPPLSVAAVRVAAPAIPPKSLAPVASTPAPTQPQSVTAQWTVPKGSPSVTPVAPSATPTIPPPVRANATVATPVKDPAVEKTEPKPQAKEKIEPAAKEVAAQPEISQTALATNVTGEPEPPLFGQVATESGSRRFLVPALLVAIVIAAATAGIIWWKAKNAQLGSGIVTQSQAANPPETATPVQSASSQPSTSPAVPAPDSDTSSDANEASSATPQEVSKFPHVTGIRHWSSSDSSTIVLDLEDQVQYEAHRLTGPDRVYFDLHDTQLASDLVNKSMEIGDAFVGRVRMAQPVPGMTRIVLETRADTNFSVSLESNPYRLIVEVRKVGTTPKGAVNLFPNAPQTEKEKLAIVIPPPTKEDLQLRARVPKMRIVVDAGHGGWDLGTVGRRGLLEKDVVLEIAQRLGKLLQSRLGADVIYTRQDDNYIPLDERAEIANQSQADLFISVHANYSDLPSARGVETYFTNSFSAPGSKTAGTKDADAHAVAGEASNTPTLSPADLHDRIEQSRRLAMSVQRSLYGSLAVENPGLRDRGTKEAAFVVLTESAMPGILAEVSFVSSPTDEQKLRSDGYRERIAEALYRGVARYAATAKGVKMASASRQ